MTELGTELPAKSRRRKPRDPNPGLNVLRTESKEDFIRVLEQIREYIGPTNPIDEMYIRDAAHYTWQIMLYGRVETDVLNNALRRALSFILNEILLPPSLDTAVKCWDSAQRLSYSWLFDPESKRQVRDLLEEAGLDESAIEAKAFTLVADDLEKAHRMVTMAEDGRDKALRNIAKSRKKSFADRLRRASDRVLAADQVPSIAIGEEN